MTNAAHCMRHYTIPTGRHAPPVPVPQPGPVGIVWRLLSRALAEWLDGIGLRRYARVWKRRGKW